MGGWQLLDHDHWYQQGRVGYRHLFLFNDAVLVCKPVGGTKSIAAAAAARLRCSLPCVAWTAPRSLRWPDQSPVVLCTLAPNRSHQPLITVPAGTQLQSPLASRWQRNVGLAFRSFPHPPQMPRISC